MKGELTEAQQKKRLAKQQKQEKRRQKKLQRHEKQRRLLSPADK